MTKAISAKSKGKLSKKDLKQDRLMEYTVKAETLYHQNKNWVIGVLIAIVVVILGVVIFSKSQKSARLEQSYHLTMAKMAYGGGQLEEAKAAFQQVVSQFGGRSAGEAHFFLGRIAFEQQDYQTAETQFRTYIDDFSVDVAMDAAAHAGLAATLEAQGQLDPAMDQYERLAAKYSGVPFAPQALMEVARLAEKQNQPERARKALQTVVDKYPKSSSVQKARKDLEALE